MRYKHYTVTQCWMVALVLYCHDLNINKPAARLHDQSPFITSFYHLNITAYAHVFFITCHNSHVCHYCFCRDKGELIALKNTGGALGIHVVPEYDEQGRLVSVSHPQTLSDIDT